MPRWRDFLPKTLDTFCQEVKQEEGAKTEQKGKTILREKIQSKTRQSNCFYSKENEK